MANPFEELLLQTLNDVRTRLERVENRSDHIVNEKADKSDVAVINKRLDRIEDKLDQKADKSDIDELKSGAADMRGDINTLGQRLDRIESGINTLKWVIGAGAAVISVTLALLKLF